MFSGSGESQDARSLLGALASAQVAARAGSPHAGAVAHHSLGEGLMMDGGEGSTSDGPMPLTSNTPSCCIFNLDGEDRLL
jgi:hypothetical protein